MRFLFRHNRSVLCWILITLQFKPEELSDLQGAAKKMTQHVKCDYLVTPENFCAKFCMIV